VLKTIDWYSSKSGREYVLKHVYKNKLLFLNLIKKTSINSHLCYFTDANINSITIYDGSVEFNDTIDIS
jgi:hypothetical protein